MKNRLQFNRHFPIFSGTTKTIEGEERWIPGRDQAKEWLDAKIKRTDFIPLIGEPIVLRYLDNAGNKQLILAVGKATGNTTADTTHREYHIIDSAKLSEGVNTANENAAQALDLATAVTKDIANYRIILQNMIGDNGIEMEDGSYFETDDPSGCGLYKVYPGTNYISAATSLAKADYILDTELGKANENIDGLSEAMDETNDKIDELSAGTEALSDKVDELSANTIAADQALDNKINELSAGTISEINSVIEDTNNAISELSNEVNEKIVILSAGTIQLSADTKAAIDALSANTVAAINEATADADSKIAELSAGTIAADNALNDRIDALSARTITGQDAIKVNGEGDRVVSLLISDNDKVLSQDVYGLKANLTLSYDSQTKMISLNGKNNELIGEINAADFIKDGMLESANVFIATEQDHQEYPQLVVGEAYLKLVFNTDAGKDPIFISVKDLVDEYTVDPDSRNYMEINDYVVSLKVDEDGGLAGYDNMKHISAVTANIIEAAGLNAGEEGGYPGHDETHYIKYANSLDNADVLLDEAIWNTSGMITDINNKVDELSGNTTGLIRELSAVTREFSADTYNTIRELSGAVNGFEERISENEENISELSASVVTNRENITNLSGASANMSGAVVSNKEMIEKLSAGTIHDLNELSGAVVNNQTNINNVSGAAVANENKISNLSGVVESLSAHTVEEINRLDDRIDKLSAGTIELVASSAASVFASAKTYVDEQIADLNSDTAATDNKHYITALTISNGKISAIGEEELPEYDPSEIYSAMSAVSANVISYVDEKVEALSGDVITYADEKVEALSGDVIDYVNEKADEVYASAATYTDLAIEGLDSNIEASAGKYITGIAIANGKFSSFTEELLPTTDLSGVYDAISGLSGSVINYVDDSVEAISGNLETLINELSAGTVMLVGASAASVYSSANSYTDGAIADAIAGLDSSVSAETGKYITAIAIDNGKISAYAEESLPQFDPSYLENAISGLSGDVISYVDEQIAQIPQADLSYLEQAVSGVSATVINNQTNITNLSAGTIELVGASASSVFLSAKTYVDEQIAAIPALDVTYLEQAISGVSEDVKELSGSMISYVNEKTSGVLTVKRGNTELGKYATSANSIIDVDVTGADVLLTGYEIATASSDIAATDTVNEAFGKIQKKAKELDELINTISGAGDVSQLIHDINTVSGDVIELSASVVTNKTNITTLSSATVDLSGVCGNFFDGAEYVSSAKTIVFTHQGTVKDSIDATAFIKDGMLNNVDLTVSGGEQYIEFTFNTDSGKEPIDIKVSDFAALYSAGNGISISNENVIAAKLANKGDVEYLKLDGDGLYLSGITQMKDNALGLINDLSAVTLTGVSMNGSAVSVANHVATLGNVITAETQLSSATTGTGNVVTSLLVSNHEITYAKDFNAAAASDLNALSAATTGMSGNLNALSASVVTNKTNIEAVSGRTFKYYTATTDAALDLSKYLTILTVNSNTALTVDELPEMVAGTVEEAHVIISNTGSSLIQVTIPSGGENYSVVSTSGNVIYIAGGQMGELNAMITYDGNAYIIYIITT